MSRPTGEYAEVDADFIAELLDRFIQLHPPNFTAAAKKELEARVLNRYAQSPDGMPAPPQVLAALDLIRLLADKPSNTLALYIQRTGPNFTLDEETCTAYLQNRPTSIQLSEEQVSVSLTYTTISLTPQHNPAVLVAALARVLPSSFRWQDVVAYFDHSGARITSAQFLRLYNALLPVARDDNQNFDIQRLWGGEWENPETQLSFICAYASLAPDQLDATTIPRLKPTFTLDEYVQSPPAIRERAAYAVRHPLVSEAAVSAIINVALQSSYASQSIEAKRLFQDVVLPHLGIFVVSASGVPRPWPMMAEDTFVSLFERFLNGSGDSDFVMDSLWRTGKDWVKDRLVDAHAAKPNALPAIFQLVLRHGWLDELVVLPNGFSFDLAALAHAEGYLDLHQWHQRIAERRDEFSGRLLHFLMIKASYELTMQRTPQDVTTPQTTLRVKTVFQLLQIVEELLPKTPVPELIQAQRTCITAYPRLINYGEGYDDIIDNNGRESNALSPAANAKMEEHYKKMYGDEIQVRDIVEILDRYKRSRDPLDQDAFACMIHGLFDEYPHYVDYPLEALATTAVLFGGIISHKLISEVPLQVGLGMILEAVRDHHPDESMYKFGLQALMQLFGRLSEWPGFCSQLHQIPGLRGTEAWKMADEVVREHGERSHPRNGGPAAQPDPLSNDQLTNGGLEDGLSPDQHAPPFAALRVDPPFSDTSYEDPDAEVQGKIQFVLNNLTDATLQSMFKELREMLDFRHQQWFASHLVEERAKMQPNYHHVYLELVKQFEDQALWFEVLRETYVSVTRMLNSEVTLQNSTERTHLKNLGGWLGLLTLARDKPIKHRNIAFKQLLIEAHDTKRLIIVIPFVCKVLQQGVTSNIFRPPNPWLMDILHLLIELYHNAELKLNLKFEIEVLCKALNLDHKSIEPSGEILNRAPVEEVVDMVGQDALDSFESLSLNGMAGVTNTLSSHAALPVIPDLGPSLSIPQTEVIAHSKLHEITREALTRALQDIIQPVVDRSVTIAAISTQQMIHKDFATEPDEHRVRTAAINMVKSTAGSLALVTSKEPLRANFANYLRNLTTELPQGLPEGIIMLCVNSNLDLASSVIEKSAEERAVPEIEEMIEPEMEIRRRHRLQRPTEPYVDPQLSRWSMTIPHPFKLGPNPSGLNAEQMAIYDDFARQPRAAAAPAAPALLPANSDTRSLTEVIGDQYNPIPSIPTPAETPSMPPHLGAPLPHYAQTPASLASRQAGINQFDARSVTEKVNRLLDQLTTAATNAPEEHFAELPRPHSVLDVIDALVQLIIKTQQTSEEFVAYAANQISQHIFRRPEDTLLLESLVHVLETVRKIAGPATSLQIRALFHQQPGSVFLHRPLVQALLRTDLLDWKSIDSAMSKALQQREEGFVEFLEQLLDLALLNESPLALYADFVRSLEEAWTWISEEPDVPGGQRLKSKVLSSPPPLPPTLTQEERNAIKLDQLEYVFDEWVYLCNNPAASETAADIFVQQMHAQNIIGSKDDLYIFYRQALDKSAERYEHVLQATRNLTESFQAIDALAKMTFILVKPHPEASSGSSARAQFVDSILSLSVMVLNGHHTKRADGFNQRVFFRFYSMLLHELHAKAADFTAHDQNRILMKFSNCFYDLRPSLYPDFVFAWIALLSHRCFLPVLVKAAGDAGRASYFKLLQALFLYVGDLVKPLRIPDMGKEIYEATIKLTNVLQHDYPEILIAYHVQLTQSLPPHCTQLVNMVLMATPPSVKLADPFQPGLKVERMPDIKEPPVTTYDAAAQLRQVGLVNIVDYMLENGPTEDAIAQIHHAISKPDGDHSTYGFVPIMVNRAVIDALVAYIGGHAIRRAGAKSDSTVFVPGAPDAQTLRMLVGELSPEPRYYLLLSMVNELRYPNMATHYFGQALLEIFGHDMSDPEEDEVRQVIVRILLERLVGYWPHPWGLMITVMELVKNDRYQFFELPFIKASPDVCRLFEDKVVKAKVF